MPLVLSMRQGDDFYVADDQYVLDAIVGETVFTVRRAKDQKTFRVTDEMSVELDTDVFASAGERHQTGLARVVIDAPRSILIVRGDKYRNPPEHVRAH